MSKPIIDDMLCIHCGTCATLCPNVFSWQPGEAAKVKDGANFSELKCEIDQAINSCPAKAISWQENQDNK